MSRRPEDRKLWDAVARTIERPLRRQDGSGVVPGSAAHAGKPRETLAQEMARLMGTASRAGSHPLPVAPAVASKPQGLQRKQAPVQHPIEDAVLRKLAKGRRDVDARLDLHGMRQDAARDALLTFLHASISAGHRIVLVITGKGNDGTGVLRRSVPLWLETEPFASMINGMRRAHISHGGDGALYVRLRRGRRVR